MKIGVFDSGIGGKSIADSLSRDFPHAQIMYVHDSEHVPYGGREESEIIQLTEAAIQPLISGNCDCIVIACNTATAAAIEYLRETYPDGLFIGLEPMVKPAAQLTKSGVITVCATPYTLKSSRYLGLKNTYAKKLTVIEPDCSEWATMIERDDVDRKLISSTIESALEQGSDVIVLACTHYHWIKELIIEVTNGRAVVVDPSEAIGRRVAELLSHQLSA